MIKTIDLRLFFSALFQVALVAMNVVFISKGYFWLLLLTGGGISLFWTFNIKKVAFGGWKDRLTYTFGAMCGTGLGYLISNQIVHFI